MAMRFFNSLGKTLQEFVPITAGKVGFYGCGPTVYNYAHIGNLRAYVFLDILDRTFTFFGYDKTHVMNITDIGHLSGNNDSGEDKMLESASKRGKSVMEIAQFYTDAFFKDIDALNIRRPDVVCRATEHIPEMIELIKKIEANGHTYSAGGNLYFDVSTFPDYWALVGHKPKEDENQARVAADTNKRNKEDFVLWFTKSKFENHALVWDSPWGQGYPGWHVECSAMSTKYLGEHFDIHTGGIDHIPVHHTNEIAQSVCAMDKAAPNKNWVNYWLHNEFLVLASGSGGGKMSKSSGNFLTLTTLIENGFDPLDYRFFLLGSHYRSQVVFSENSMQGAKNGRKALVERIAKFLPEAAGKAEMSEKAAVYINDFKAALENDLSTPLALSVLQIAVKDADIPPAEKIALVQKMDEVLGLRLIESAKSLGADNAGALSDAEIAQVEKLIKERTDAKKAKNYARADEIRAELTLMGIVLEDTSSGTVWRKKT